MSTWSPFAGSQEKLCNSCQGKTRKAGSRPAFPHIGCYLCCSVVICVVRLLFVLFGCYLCCSVVICVVRLLFVLFYVLFVCKCVLPPGDNPIAFNKYIISYFQTKIQLCGFSAYPNAWPSYLIRIGGVLLYWKPFLQQRSLHS